MNRLAFLRWPASALLAGTLALGPAGAAEPALPWTREGFLAAARRARAYLAAGDIFQVVPSQTHARKDTPSVLQSFVPSDRSSQRQ